MLRWIHLVTDEPTRAGALLPERLDEQDLVLGCDASDHPDVVALARQMGILIDLNGPGESPPDDLGM